MDSLECDMRSRLDQGRSICRNFIDQVITSIGPISGDVSVQFRYLGRFATDRDTNLLLTNIEENQREY